MPTLSTPLLSPLDITQPWAHPKAHRLDATTVETWIERNVLHPLPRAAFRAICSTVFCAEASQVSLLFFLHYLKSGGGLEVLISSDTGAAQSLVSHGGVHQISRMMVDDAGMKDLLSFLIARDTMHQQQWLAVIEELGGIEATMPIPNSTPTSHEATEHSYYFLNTSLDTPTPQGKWMDGGPTMDGRSTYTARDKDEPEGQVPSLGKAREKSGAQTHRSRVAGGPDSRLEPTSTRSAQT